MPPLAVSIVLLAALMHAGWNLIVRDQRATDIFLRILLVIGIVGIGPALVAEIRAAPIVTAVGGYLLIAGLFQGLYFTGLTLGYRHGDFTVVYPLARALPVLLVAVSDMLRGNALEPLGWLGIFLVSLGCLLMPLESLRSFSLARYWNSATIWILLTALATTGYTIVDSAAGRILPRSPWTALRYGLFESFVMLAFYWLLLKLLRRPITLDGTTTTWKQAAAAAILLFGGYTLVLWAYQLSPHAGYVLAMRQFSIVVGVAAGAFIFREPAPGFRIRAALIITLGVVCIALTR